jgi:hypothetical protein
VRFRTREHVAASELTSVERRGPGPQSTWQNRSSPQQVCGVRNYKTCGSIRAHHNMEMGSGAIGHVAAREPSLAGRRGPGSHGSACMNALLFVLT